MSQTISHEMMSQQQDPDVASVADWLKQISNQSEALPRTW